MENKIKVHILGAAAVIVSAVKLEDWKLAEKYAPEKLTVRDKDGEPVFRVMTSGGTGSVNHYGVVWGNYSTEEGNATVTVLFDEEVVNKKEAIMDIAGSAILALTDMENEMPGILEGIREKTERMGTYIDEV